MVVRFWVKHSMTKNPLISTDFRPSVENDNINLFTYPIGIKCLSPVGFGDWTYPKPKPKSISKTQNLIQNQNSNQKQSKF